MASTDTHAHRHARTQVCECVHTHTSMHTKIKNKSKRLKNKENENNALPIKEKKKTAGNMRIFKHPQGSSELTLLKSLPVNCKRTVTFSNFPSVQGNESHRVVCNPFLMNNAVNSCYIVLD